MKPVDKKHEAKLPKAKQRLLDRGIADVREEIFTKYLGSPEQRSRLAQALVHPTELRLRALQAEPHNLGLLAYAQSSVAYAERIQDALQGDEALPARLVTAITSLRGLI